MPLDHPNVRISGGLETDNTNKVDHEYSASFYVSKKDTRNTVKWVEMAWRVPTNTLQVPAVESLARICTEKHLWRGTGALKRSQSGEGWVPTTQGATLDITS
jgi:hypothetical protein